MKITAFILLLLLYASTAVAVSFEYEKKCLASVDGKTAQFSFPTPKGKPLSWNMKETNEMTMEYSWEICVERVDTVCKYRFGVLHFKFSPSEEKGSITELLSHSQKSVWDRDDQVQPDMKVDAEIEHDNLIIRITDQKTFLQLFSDKPTIARCKVKTPYANLNFESKTEIKYNE